MLNCGLHYGMECCIILSCKLCNNVLCDLVYLECQLVHLTPQIGILGQTIALVQNWDSDFTVPVKVNWPSIHDQQ